MTLARFRSAEDWVAGLGPSRKPTALTIGNFDGMHLGHQEILKRVIAQAREKQLAAAVLTFFPHPVRVLRPAEAPSLLMTLDQRLAAFEAAGVEAALVLAFNEALSQMSAEDFIKRHLVDVLRARKILVGENFRFGHRQQGNVGTLQGLGEGLGFGVEVVGSLSVNGIVVSSTAIRNAVGSGRMEAATQLLGRPFSLVGQIQKGTGQGRRLVVPTLNLSTEQEMLPMTGVYVTSCRIGERVYRSVTNVGVRPTFNGARTTVESHLLGFSEDLISGSLEVQFLTRLRDERKFVGPEALREQVLQDIEKAKRLHGLGKS